MHAVHTDRIKSARTDALAVAGHVAPSQPATLLILRERPDVVAARIARKRSVADAILVTHGTLKRSYLAAVLGVAESYVKRCLSESERAEFSEAHLARLSLPLAGEGMAA
jgi:hypothetical protein